MAHTTDPSDPRLHRGIDASPTPQHDVYLVLSDAERKAGFLRPVRRSYVHDRTTVSNGREIAPCGMLTTMSTAIAQTYARDPKFYGATYCTRCAMHLSVEAFVWEGTTELVGS